MQKGIRAKSPNQIVAVKTRSAAYPVENEIISVKKKQIRRGIAGRDQKIEPILVNNCSWANNWI